MSSEEQQGDAAAAAAAKKEEEDAPAADAAAAAGEEEEKDADGGHGVNKEAVEKVLSSSGPIVKAVLLKHLRSDGKDGKPHPISDHQDVKHKRVVLTEDIEEIQLDTTPSKNAVKKVLGGPFTFLGQFPTEGTVVMVRKDLPDDLEELGVHQLRDLCSDRDIDTKGMIEKQELVDALVDSELPVNPHRLQPPLNGASVRGDILIVKVAETDEALDEPGGENKELEMMSNEEFFLDYTKAEYVAFASRTDVVAPEPPSPSGGSDEDEDDDDDDDFEPGEDGEPDEEDRQAMLNLVMGEVLRKFREEHGRGPETRELLELREQVAAQLGVHVATVEALDQEKKRMADGEPSPHSPKKVKFTEEEEGSEGENGEGSADKKLAAKVVVPPPPLAGNDGEEEDEEKPEAKRSATNGDGGSAEDAKKTVASSGE